MACQSKMASPQKTLRGTGFFHFGKPDLNAYEELERAMSVARSAAEIDDFLIVLPEAFNRGSSYDAVSDPRYGASVPQELYTLSGVFGVAFVAGLVVTGIGPAPGYSSAYFIDGTTSHLICHKVTRDDSDRNYVPCPLEDADINNPLCYYANASVGALICRDADDENVEKYRFRQHALLEAMRQSPIGVICIPAFLTRYETAGLVKGFGSNYVVLANANGLNWRPSAIFFKNALDPCFADA